MGDQGARLLRVQERALARLDRRQLPLEHPDAGDEIRAPGAEAEQAELPGRPRRLPRLGLPLEHVGDLLLHLELLALQLERPVAAADPPGEQGVVAC